MFDGAEDDDLAVIYGQQHPMYGTVGMQPGMRGGMQRAPSIVSNVQALQTGQQVNALPMAGSLNPIREIPQG